MEGNPANPLRGAQTVLLGSSNSAIVEFAIPEDGAYIMVDHHFANASQGAIGLISTTANAQPTLLHNVRGPEVANLHAHAVHVLTLDGPTLAAVTVFREQHVIERFTAAP